MYWNLEEQALKLALAKSWISKEQKQEVEELPTSEINQKGQWGPRLDALIKQGLLNERQVIELIKEVSSNPERDSDVTQGEETPALSTESSLPGFGRYENLELLGAGGMARVYKAYDPTLGRHVALKLIRGERPDLEERLIMESRAQARIEHEHVCKIFEAGEIEGKRYIAMQYINGLNLKQLHSRLTMEQKVLLIKDVAEGIHAAHRAGLIHRDLKPANIMVERDEDGSWIPYVMDFGLAKEIASGPGLTKTGIIMGTPWYMSPEQASGEVENLDRRSDVYSLGTTLYELLAGQLPFPGENSLEVVMKIIKDEPPPLSKLSPKVPPDLETIVMKCLEKNPSRRYDSAKALADDLERYLEGDTILARRPTISYRLRVKARKNKAILAVLLPAVIAVLVFAIVGIRAQLTARQRAAVAQRFGQEVERINAMLRIAFGVPIHDIRKEKQIVRQKMKDIETQMRQLGSIAQGPGNYVLGSCYLSLDEPEEALNRLQESLNRGYRDPEVSYAMGLALGQIYQKKLGVVASIQNANEREHQRKLIEKKYRDPAIQYLHSGRGYQMAAPEYLEGLIAFYEKRFPEALQKADLASQKYSWLHEANLLKGDVHSAVGTQKRESGELDAALSSYKLAGEAYELAIKVGESDVRGYQRMTQLALDAMTAELFIRSGDLQPYFDKAMHASDLALKVDPDNSDVYTSRSVAYRMLAEDLESRGKDPTELLQRGTESAETAIRLNPKDPFAHRCLGTVWDLISFTEGRQGKDPRPAVQKGVESLQKALELDPDNSHPYNILCILHSTQALYEKSHGADPLPAFQKSIEAGKKGLELNPRNLNVRTNLGNAFLYLSSYELSRGKDPRSSLDQAIAAYEAVLHENPKMTYAVDYLSRSFVHKGNYESLNGSDPTASYQRGIEVIKRSLELQPDDSFPRFMMWEAYSGLAKYKAMIGEDPTETIEKATGFWDEGVKSNPNLAEGYANQAIFLAVGIRFDLENNRDPEKKIKQAEAHVSKALLLDPNNFKAYFARGNLQVLRALRLQKKGASSPAILQSAKSDLSHAAELNPGDPRTYVALAELYGLYYDANHSNTFVEEGLKMIRKAVEMNQLFAEAYVFQGFLLLKQARFGSTVEERNKAGQAAAKSFRKAIEINSNLRPLYGKYINDTL